MKYNCYMVSFFAKYKNKTGLGFAFINSNKSLFNIIEDIKTNIPTGCVYKNTFCIKKCNQLKNKIKIDKIDYRFDEFKNIKYFKKK